MALTYTVDTTATATEPCLRCCPATTPACWTVEVSEVYDETCDYVIDLRTVTKALE